MNSANETGLYQSNQFRYAIYGAAFGFCFPIIATLIRANELGLSLVETQKADMLLWIIDTAPLFLGIFASLAGLRQDNIEKINRGLDQEVKRRTEDLVKARDAAEVASRAKGIFLANMSHEIRTPLNSILGFAQALMRDAAITAKQKELTTAISKSGNHLLLLINNILDLSKVEAHRMELNPSEFMLCDFLSDLSDIFRVSAKEKQLNWSCRGFENNEQTVRVVGDQGKLRQVLTNLLGNAMKFTKNEIKFYVNKSDGDNFLFEVIDNGPGIPSEAQSSIFEPFHQAEAGIKAGGTGLGLSISKKMVEIMGGQLKVDSVPGLGTRFYFSLPLKVVHQAHPMDVSAAGSRCQVELVAPSSQQQPAGHAAEPAATASAEVARPTTISTAAEQPKAAPVVQADVPKDFNQLLEKIKQAADLYKITEIKQYAAELERHGPSGKELSEKIMVAVSAYDMSAILEAAQNYKSAA